ncbi:Na+/H+ antiporter NhaC family protein [Flavobacterium sp. J27]|uniref:Na+/H+ antiporter NhaC family protein n=1 Tax=Flavobacterium sp. J27 TaxID=2060419 RepID=UPI0010320EBA|nr:Na+/H+ antiporter NhaC family protein [Flavobacterium sp. J27]
MDTKIIKNKELNIWEALIPVVALVIMLGYNVYVFGDSALGGSNQFILILGAAVAAIVGFFNKVSYQKMIEEVAENIKSTAGAILILLMVGALAGTWLISGIIPSMIYYGLQILSPAIFLPATLIICSVISIATGSSWTTSATVGIALIGIGGTLGFPLGMVAGAVISGAYFGDKLSPMSDTTNLAPAMAGTDLFTHIKYMALTTVPTYVVSLILFIILGLTVDTAGVADSSVLLADIEKSFHITPWLFIVPIIVIGLIVKKTEPLIALLVGTLLAGVFAIIFQSSIIWNKGLRYSISEIPSEFKEYVQWDTNFNSVSKNAYQSTGTYALIPKNDEIKLSENIKVDLTSNPNELKTIEKEITIFKNEKEIGNYTFIAKPTNYLTTSYIAILNAITTDNEIHTDNTELADLFKSGGMQKMLSTIWLILCAMVFGGIMDAIGALSRISQALLNLAKSTFGLFASTVGSCLALNITASDQYLAIVVPGKMFAKAYADKGLAPENLSRTLEDSGTVTSVLIPWNTCGAYQSGTLGVETFDYLPYAFFNLLSPFMTLLFAAFNIKIRQLVSTIKK